MSGHMSTNLERNIRDIVASRLRGRRRLANLRPRDERGRYVKKDTEHQDLVRKTSAAIRDAIMNGGGTVKMGYKPEPSHGPRQDSSGYLLLVRLALVTEIEDAQTAVYMRRVGCALLAVQRMAHKSTEGEATNTHEE
ncbi:MAG: hypothetical protein NUW01_20210 [Gemmatimonadaceae bacterium]|nr:hypothetical protein [Gemmatimonadaceae bacterium]